MTRRTPWPLLALVALFAGAPLAASGAPADVHVDAYDEASFDLFEPSALTVPRGTTLVFEFSGSRSHTATDGTGMGLYDSGVVAPGGPSFSYRYDAAGRYPFVCTLHAGMSGAVTLPITVSPSSVATGDTVVVRWARMRAADGHVYDVRIRKPGGSWRAWRHGVVGKERTFEPARTGTFRFRARMRAQGGDAASGWSPPAAVTVG